MKPPKKQMRLAQRVRKAAEQCLEPHRSKTLSGMCGVASAALAHVFRKHGFPSTCVDGMYGATGNFMKDSYHTWVESNGHIWDLTATQFKRNEKVLVVRKDRARAFKQVSRSTRTSLCSVSRQIIRRAGG